MISNDLATQDPLKTQNSNKPKPPRRPTEREKEQGRRDFWSRFPVVDYDAPEPNDPSERAKRQKKNKHYDRQGLVSKNPSASGESTFRMNHWASGLSALPAGESDAVLTVEIKRAEAHLSHDKSGVYSEFSAQIADVMKDASSRLQAGTVITVRRVGGVIHYPNGHKELYAIAEQHMPIVGGRYLLFLKAIEPGEDYEIVTGYQFENGQVMPLDAPHQFRVFAAAEQSNFLKEVRDKIILSQPTPSPF